MYGEISPFKRQREKIVSGKKSCGSGMREAQDMVEKERVEKSFWKDIKKELTGISANSQKFFQHILNIIFYYRSNQPHSTADTYSSTIWGWSTILILPSNPNNQPKNVWLTKPLHRRCPPFFIYCRLNLTTETVNNNFYHIRFTPTEVKFYPLSKIKFFRLRIIDYSRSCSETVSGISRKSNT